MLKGKPANVQGLLFREEQVGYLAGYLYPTLMYYREFRITPEGPGEHAPPPPAQPTFTFLPVLSPNAAQLAMLGFF